MSARNKERAKKSGFKFINVGRIVFEIIAILMSSMDLRCATRHQTNCVRFDEWSY
jgi:hypothetical protein